MQSSQPTLRVHYVSWLLAVITAGALHSMKVGVFTPLLSQLPLPAVLEKLRKLNIDIVELGTGNYPGDAHCKLTMLDDGKALAEFQKVLADHGISISALSCHGNPLHPDADFAKQQ